MLSVGLVSGCCRILILDIDMEVYGSCLATADCEFGLLLLSGFNSGY